MGAVCGPFACGPRPGEVPARFSYRLQSVELQNTERRAPAGAAALARLIEGNARFAHDVRSVDVLATTLRRQALLERQSPFATVLSCSDSRVPAAVAATLDAMRGDGAVPSANIGDIVERIRPAVQEVLWADVARDELLARAVRANVRWSVRQLCTASRILEQLIGAQRLTVVGAEYSLDSGEVRILE